ncbi:hypothetical protein C7974DRAFT_4705 [Boeremia exigua]|uniref:uncharacterized protein n=1 Tax=Boeremia exigua TaxID=749465 RepID=UPI001E8D3570|nr:uncharacterized protein C7974DRAFT_4705 [Boeremia exigua]KAH6643752.1 hypothetical protein C7974DRAFT_4705 [Boeremia exigua]
MRAPSTLWLLLWILRGYPHPHSAHECSSLRRNQDSKCDRASNIKKGRLRDTRSKGLRHLLSCCKKDENKYCQCVKPYSTSRTFPAVSRPAYSSYPLSNLQSSFKPNLTASVKAKYQRSVVQYLHRSRRTHILTIIPTTLSLQPPQQSARIPIAPPPTHP